MSALVKLHCSLQTQREGLLRAYSVEKHLLI